MLSSSRRTATPCRRCASTGPICRPSFTSVSTSSARSTTSRGPLPWIRCTCGGGSTPTFSLSGWMMSSRQAGSRAARIRPGGWRKWSAKASWLRFSSRTLACHSKHSGRHHSSSCKEPRGSPPGTEPSASCRRRPGPPERPRRSRRGTGPTIAGWSTTAQLPPSVSVRWPWCRSTTSRRPWPISRGPATLVSKGLSFRRSHRSGRYSIRATNPSGASSRTWTCR